MTGLLCITALTNEHSNKGELKDQCMCVRRNGAVIRMCSRTGHRVWVRIVCSCDGKIGGLTRGNEGRKQKKREGGSVSHQAWAPWCVTTEEALNNSHDIDLVTLLPTSLPCPGRESPPVGSPLPPPLM